MSDAGRFSIIPPARARSTVDTDPVTGEPTVSHQELVGEIYETASGRRGFVAGPSRLYGESDVVVLIPLTPDERPLSAGHVYRARDGRRYEYLSVAVSQVVQQIRQRQLARGQPLDMPSPGLGRGHVRTGRERLERELNPPPPKRRTARSIAAPDASPPRQQGPRSEPTAWEVTPLAAQDVEQTSMFDLGETVVAEPAIEAPASFVAELGDRGRWLVWAANGTGERRLVASGAHGSARDLRDIARALLEEALDVDQQALRADPQLDEQFALDCEFFAVRYLRTRPKAGWTLTGADIRGWMAFHRPPSLAYTVVPPDSPLAEEKQRWLGWRSRSRQRELADVAGAAGPTDAPSPTESTHTLPR